MVTPSAAGRQAGSEEEEVVELVAGVEAAPGLVGAALGGGGGVGEEGGAGDVGCGAGVQGVESGEGGDGGAGAGEWERGGGSGEGGVDGEVVLVVVVEEGVLQGGAVRVYGVGAVGEVVPAGDVVGDVVDAHGLCAGATEGW